MFVAKTRIFASQVVMIPPLCCASPFWPTKKKHRDPFVIIPIHFVAPSSPLTSANTHFIAKRQRLYHANHFHRHHKNTVVHMNVSRMLVIQYLRTQSMRSVTNESITRVEPSRHIHTWDIREVSRRISPQIWHLRGSRLPIRGSWRGPLLASRRPNEALCAFLD